MAVVCSALGGLSGCGEQEVESAASLPRSGTAYRGLGEEARLAVAAACRDRAAAAADGTAAEQLAGVDPAALRAQLDTAFRRSRAKHRPVAEVCDEQLPFVTPGLRVAFDDAKDSGDAFTYETDSDIPLEIRGTVAPAPEGGTVVARRESGGPRAHRVRIGAGGSFALPAIRLRKVADNSFVVAIHAPPSAPRKVYFSAICLDCLAAGPAPVSR
jgi:hypothetical protein